MKSHLLLLLPYLFCCKPEICMEKPYSPTGMKQRDSTEITVSPLTISPKQKTKALHKRIYIIGEDANMKRNCGRIGCATVYSR